MHKCKQCGLILNSAAWLDIHETEEHSPFFNGQFQCLVAGCPKRFKNATKRYFHLTEGHLFPKEFRFPTRPPKHVAIRKAQPQQVKKDKKTILCRYIKTAEGSCPHGDNCWFQHDRAALVPDQISFGRHAGKIRSRVDAMDISE